MSIELAILKQVTTEDMAAELDRRGYDVYHRSSSPWPEQELVDTRRNAALSEAIAILTSLGDLYRGYSEAVKENTE
jgi:hypothetical protein